MSTGSAALCQICGLEIPSEEAMEVEFFELSPGGSNYLGSSFFNPDFWTIESGAVTDEKAHGVFRDFRRWSVDTKNQYHLLRGVPVLEPETTVACVFSARQSKSLVFRVDLGRWPEGATPADDPVMARAEISLTRGSPPRVYSLIREFTSTSAQLSVSSPSGPFGDQPENCTARISVFGARWWFDAAQVMEEGDDLIYTTKGSVIGKKRKKARVRAIVCQNCYDDDSMEVL